jgi:hypothetical protein
MKDTYLKLRISNDNYEEFQKTCDRKNKTMSEVLHYFIESYSDSENLVLLDVDTETLKNTHMLCKEKKIKFNYLVKFLLERAIINKDKLNIK